MTPYPDESPESEQIRKSCWELRFYSFGTAKIFEHRANKYNRRQKALTFLGISVPIAVGGAVLAFGSNAEKILIVVAPVAGILSVIQLLASTWSLVADWNGEALRSTRAVSNNHVLANRFDDLGKSPPTKLTSDYPRVHDEYQRQHSDDSAVGVTDKEHRRGYRYALIQYGSTCKTCGDKPKNMQPTDCGSCGDF